MSNIIYATIYDNYITFLPVCAQADDLNAQPLIAITVVTDCSLCTGNEAVWCTVCSNGNPDCFMGWGGGLSSCLLAKSEFSKQCPLTKVLHANLLKISIQGDCKNPLDQSVYVTTYNTKN